MGGEEGGGDTGRSVGGMTVSMAFDTQFFLAEMASEVMKSSGSTWVGVIFIPEELVLTISKHLCTSSSIEVYEVINTGSNCSKPIIKYDMKLWGDGTSVQVEDKGTVLP